MKLKQIQRYFILFTATLSVASVVYLSYSASAAEPTSSVDAGGAKVYAAKTSLDVGTVVQLNSKSANLVEAAVQTNLENMFGVVIDPNQLPLRISNNGVKNAAYVSVSGTHDVLVSTQGGDIQSGDYLTLSAISGIVMKAGTEEKTVFGRANRPFNDSSTTLGTATLKDVEGKDNKEVKLGSTIATINIQRNPNIKSTKANVPDFLERVGQAIAEKEVSPVRIYISMGIAAVSLIAAIAVLYSGVRGSVISIGRNPMSKKSIFRALLEVMLTSLVILIIGLFAVYLLLKL